MGVYLEETVTVTVANTITVSCNIANAMAKEFWIYDPDNHGSYTKGVVKLYNNTISGDIYGLITGVSGKDITVSSAAAVNDSVTVGYFAAGTSVTSTDQAPRPDLTWANSLTLYPQSVMSHANAMNYKSPANFVQAGYKWADKMFWRDITGANVSASFTKLFDTGYTDYKVDLDTFYPFFIEEIRILTEDDDLDVRIEISNGDRTTLDGSTYLIQEGGNDYIDVSSSSCTYKTNDSSNYIVSIPLGYLADGVKIYLRGTPAVSANIIMEVCGWYKKKVGV